MPFTLPRIRHAPGALQPRGQLRAWAARLLVLLLALQVLVSSLGLVHKTVHGGLLRDHGTAHVHSPVLAHSHGDASARVASTGLEHLFAGHHGHTDCEWFDRMALGSPLLPSLPALLAPAPEAFASWTVLALLLRKSPALFWARGPPPRP